MPDADATLVLIHGLFDDAAMWEHQVRFLSPHAAVATPDVLEPETVGEAADLVLASVEGPLAVAGFSMGGYVAFEMLRRAPDRVARLAFVNTSARADTPEKLAERERAIRVASSGGYERLVDEALPGALAPGRAEADPALMETLRTMALRVGPEAWCRQQRICMSRPDSRDLLAGVACPTLALTGRRDAIIAPSLSEEMADAIPGARLAALDECGHYAPMERPWAATALLQQWLRYP